MSTERLDRALDKPMPSSPEAEAAVLGAILLDNELITQAMRLLRPEDFYVPFHRNVFLAMIKLWDARSDINSILIMEEMKRQGTAPEMVVSRITNLSYGLPHTTNILHYVKVIRGHSKGRWLVAFGSRIAAAVMDGESHPDEVAKWILEEVGDVQDTLGELRRPMSIDQMYDDHALRLQMFHKGISDAIPTGFGDIDRRLLGGGLLPGLMYIIAGRPSMGKTTFTLDVLCNAADQGRRVLVISRETPREMLLDRMIAAKSGIERFRLSPGMTKSNYELALETLQTMRLTPIVIDDFSTTIAEMDRWLAEYERKGEQIDLMALDYLQLCQGVGDSKVQEVSSVSSGFKGLCTKYKIPGLLISNLNRGAGSSEPELIHLRESGQIEFDADVVLMVHGDETEEDVEFLAKEIICKKQRDGPHFRAPMDMNTQLVTFRTPSMLGLKPEPRKIEARRMGTDEEEVAKQKAGRKGVQTSSDDAFEF